MKSFDGIKTAFGNLRKRKTRTFLTSVAIAIGTSLIIMMVGLGVGLKSLALNEIKQQGAIRRISVTPYKDDGSIKINLSSEDQEKWAEERKKNFKMIDGEAVDAFKNIPGVEDVQAAIQVNITKTKVEGKESDYSRGMGLDLSSSIFSKAEIEAVEQKENLKNLQPVIAGRTLKQGDKNAVLVGQKYLNAMQISDVSSVIGKEITLACAMPEYNGTLSKPPLIIKAEIVGVINEKLEGGNMIYMPLEMAGAMQGYYTNDDNYIKNNGPSYALINAKTVGDVNKITESLKAKGFGVQNFQSVVDQINKIFAIFEGALAIGGIIVLFVAAIGVINTMTMAIYERTRSIGIMKAMGASKGTIKRLFIMESGALGFVGGTAGLALGWLGTKVFAFGLNEYIKSKGSTPVDLFSLPLWLVLGGLAFAVFVSVLAGLYPAAKAARLDPVEALRYE